MILIALSLILIIQADFQQTLVLIKPSGVRKGLIGEIIRRLESRGLCIDAIEMTVATSQIVRLHYIEHIDKLFFPRLEQEFKTGPTVAIAVSGYRAQEIVRRLVGSTDPFEAAPGTIRGDFGLRVEANLVHASDSHGSAERELSIWFPQGYSTQNFGSRSCGGELAPELIGFY